jgi:hypothetical protein
VSRPSSLYRVLYREVAPMRRIIVLVTLALVMAALLASSALPAWAVPISEMSCAQLGQAAEETGLDLAGASLAGNGPREENLGDRLSALDREAERKDCGFGKRSDDGVVVVS